MKTILIPFAASITAVFGSIVNPWVYLPSQSQWPAILKTLDSEESVQSYITYYLDPFKQIQAAQKNTEVKEEDIQKSILTLFDLYEQACRNFRVSEADFDRHSKEVYKKLIDDAVLVFESPISKNLDPVFEVDSVKYFVFQRLDDLLIGSPKYKDFVRNYRDLRNLVGSARRYFEKKKPLQTFRYIVTRNIDLNFVGNYTVEVINSRLNRRLDNEDLQKLRFQLYSVGNSSLKLIPVFSLSIVGLLALFLI